MNVALKLDKEYRLIRAALVGAGVEMSDSMDALYRDWRRWRDKSADSIQEAAVDQWWSAHLAQFLRLIDPPHIAARADRARKDTLLSAKEIRETTAVSGRSNSQQIASVAVALAS